MVGLKRDVNVPFETTVVAVLITVIVTVRVVVLKYVAVVTVIVGKTEDVTEVISSIVNVDSDTTMEETVRMVGSGTSAIV